jgi:hypothetical protein
MMAGDGTMSGIGMEMKIVTIMIGMTVTGVNIITAIGAANEDTGAGAIIVGFSSESIRSDK